MTKITRPVTRETDIWPKGTPEKVYVTYEDIYALGLKMAARRKR